MILMFMVARLPTWQPSVRLRLVHRELRRRVDADLAELRLVQPDVVRQRLEQLLGVQRRGEDATVDLHVGAARYDAAEVDDELAWRMNDVREIDVLALPDVVVDCDADRPFLPFLFVHPP